MSEKLSLRYRTRANSGRAEVFSDRGDKTPCKVCEDSKPSAIHNINVNAGASMATSEHHHKGHTLTQLLPQSSFLLFTCLLECIGTLEELGLG